MAKVYSWEISNGVYAYIVDPSNTNKALVSRGEITNQKQLQVITDWAQNATDTQYDAQFEKMVTECANKGYSVQFEDASVYRGVSTTCDNLRGPAGRGISTIEYLRSLTDDDGTFSVYTIKYDDGTDGTLKIREGRDGKDGIDGTPGAPGDAGISSKLIMIYTSGVDADGNIIIPERPVGGSYNFISNEFVCPEGWSRNDGDDGSLTPPIWQSTRTFASTEASSDRQWSAPVQITGENGKPGEDGTSTEFIYFLGSNPPRGEALPSENIAGFVPVYESWGTTASPEGVDEDNKTEYCYTRTKNKETNVWGEWNGPTIWSKYGENGQDGDGVQYIFLKNKGQAPQNPTPFGYDAFDSTDPKIKEIFENYQNKDIEWLPPTEYQYTNLYGTDVVFKAIEELPEGSEKEPAGVWTDDPTDVDSDFQFIWVTSRKYRKSPDSGKKMWTKFSDPTLWAKFGQDGKNATSIRRLYKLTSSTGTVPDLPEDPTMTADWGTGFPKDYKYGENVVWATEAEIWAHDFEFVYSYRKVSEVDKDGNVVPPKDATNDNSLEVPYIPDSQKGYEGIEYLIDEYDGHYYKWDGGWCEPFLVTGVKGDPGDPIDYNTYVFAFGYTEYPPAPPTGNSPAFPGESMGENKILVQWYDFPDTSLYRDGIQSNGVDMRWFQCEGQVDGYTKQIKVDDTGKLKWGTVTPCNPRDGEGKTGPYYQFLFGITKDDKEPPKNFIVDGKWERRPAYYVNNEQYGWFDTDDKMPAIPAGGAMWQIWGLIDPETDTVLEVNGKGWNGPRRISGEKGEQGLQGPAGLRGVSGLPGAAQHTMYCLGTYGKDKSEYYFDTYTNPDTDKMGDGYFGDKDFQGKTIEDLEKKGWYTTKNMPYSDVLKVVNDQEFENAYKNPENQGRVIRYIRNTADSTNGSTFVNTTHQYFLVGRGGGYYIQLTGLLSEKESEEFDIYVWCIQGNDKWTNGKSAFYKKLDGTPEDANDNNTQPRNDIPATKVDNYKYLRDVATNEYYTWVEIDGGSVEHIYEGIEWSSPFKLQGTNGLRGLAGNRGQVVYPMGVYNHEEVYVTTETKAPYVYDPNDGLFYVYNIVGQPWVGRLPGYNEETREYDDTYKYIMIHPDDAEVNFKEVDYDPTTQRNEVPGYKYLRYNGNYYTWSGSAYVMASKYKYSDDGGLTWMTDQQGDTPANNFANAGTGMSPAWVRFESFQALYTSIGIIANGMIGSAVYNNEFMFSQQGINKQGEKTNYAVVSGKPGDNDSGFLSGYEFDESGYKVSLGEGKGYIVLHWKYKNTPNYINDTAVNPYEKNENGEYIHAFMPNVCINFSTGQMWLQCGKLRFGQVDSGTNVYTQEEVDRNVEEELRKQKEVIDEQIAETQRELDEMTQKLDDWDNDGLLNPTELKLLKEEYQTIKDEYASITGQAATVSISSSAYTSTYNKVINMTDNYYLNPANATATTSTDGSSFVSGGDCVVIITDSSNSYWYGWYQKYYEDRQTLLQAVSNKLNEKIGDVHNEITAATESLSKTIAANKKAIEEQVDKRADSYYQDADPSSTWQVNDSSITATYAEYRVGDLWYDTGDKKSYTFAKRNSDGKMPTAGKASDNSVLSGYYWAESDVPASVYSSIKGRSKIFVSKPTEEYHVGDLWFLEKDYADTFYGCTEKTTMASGTIMVAVISGTTYAAGNWGRRDRYADEAELINAQAELIAMNEKLTDWASDNKINESERTALKRELESIEAEYSSITGQALTVSVSSADYDTAYTNAVNVFNYYITAATDTNGCVDIVSGTTDTTKGYGWIKNYYEKRQTLLQSISDKLNGNIDNVSQKTLLAIGRLDAFSNDNYISPEERRSLKETYDGLSSEYSSITGQSKTLGLTGTTAYTDYTTWKTRAENALKYYSSTANTITDATSDYYGLIKIEYTGTGTTNVTGYGEGAKHYGNIAEYYKKKDTLQQKITEKLNQKIDDIEIPNIPDTEWLTNQFESGTTDYYGGAVLSNFLGVKNQDGDIAAFLNGSSDSAELKSSDGSSIMMLGVGVKGGVANNITLYPWTCSETVEDGYTTLYTTIDYSVSANAASVKDGAEITTYVYSNGNIINAPGFSYLKNPETSSSESSSTEQTKTLYRSVNSEANDKSGYVYSRATSLSNKNENAVKFTPTRIYSDGTVIINNLITSGGEFNGEINATGQFNGIVSSNKGYLNYYNINRSVVKNSDIILRHDFEETDTDTYENYNTLTCTDRNNNVLIKMGPASLEQNNQRYTVGVSTISSYHKNHNGNDNGQWYGTNNSWNSMCSFKVNGSEQITIPSVSMYIWIWTSGRKVVKNPYYGLRVAFYSGSTLVSSTALRSSTTVSPYKGGGKGGYSYFSVNTSAKTLTVPSSGVNKVVLEYNWKMHLHTYAWLGADKSAGEITITPNSNVLVENGQRRNIIEVGGNGMRIMNGSKDKPLFFEVMPHGITMERGDAGIRVSYDPDGDGDSGIFIKIPGQQGYRELYVGSDNVLKLYTSITDFK